ncbi:class I SAM-dependent methyltransferase [Lysobacter capsici]|uniref:class I SAM-dependent methyltransferase n=1 Tax=Lysobacter capsici TaxID=435897 RepID=UPI001BFFE656|nr:methyltransferase domain-containing protein [Lysobacter capsici]QWF16599.1 methyltransferase domain-containing protein [Lysobacter capsici]
MNPALLPHAAPKAATSEPSAPVSGRLRDLRSFLRTWLRSPARVGAIAPSSAALARLITSQVTVAAGRVLELGPGTGVFTRALLERGVAEEDLVLVEAAPEFAALLKQRFPHAQVLCADARRLPRQLSGGDDDGVAAVVSGLPLRNLSRRHRLAVLLGAFRHLPVDGAFYQFTYGAQFPLPRSWTDRHGFKVQRLGRVYGNLPPATVYRVTRRAASRWIGA